MLTGVGVIAALPLRGDTSPRGRGGRESAQLRASPDVPRRERNARDETSTKNYGAGVMSERSWCTRCQALKPVTEFRANPRMRDGLDSWCRACHVEATSAWRERNRVYIDARNAARRAEYAAERGPLERRCANPECGQTFVPARRDAKTCSKKCRGRLAYLRRKGEA
jgi:hypothetical protein